MTHPIDTVYSRLPSLALAVALLAPLDTVSSQAESRANPTGPD